MNARQKMKCKFGYESQMMKHTIGWLLHLLLFLLICRYFEKCMWFKMGQSGTGTV